MRYVALIALSFHSCMQDEKLIGDQTHDAVIIILYAFALCFVHVLASLFCLSISALAAIVCVCGVLM